MHILTLALTLLLTTNLGTEFVRQVGPDSRLLLKREAVDALPAEGNEMVPARVFTYRLELHDRSDEPELVWRERAYDYGEKNLAGVDPLIRVLDAQLDDEAAVVVYTQAAQTYCYFGPRRWPDDSPPRPQLLLRDSVGLGDRVTDAKCVMVGGDVTTELCLRHADGKTSLCRFRLRALAGKRIWTATVPERCRHLLGSGLVYGGE